MKYKIIGIFAVIGLFIALQNVPTFAATLNQLKNSYSDIIVCERNVNGSTVYRTGLCNYGKTFYISNNSVHTNKGYTIDYYDSNFNPLDSPDTNIPDGTFGNTYGFDFVICIRVQGTHFNNTSNNGSYFPTIDDYLESIKPKWYEVVWDTFKDYMTNPILGDWFVNLINRVFGDDNNGGTIAENVIISAPTLAPTPTPIPYSTVVIPKTDIISGDTVYETNYYYINPSGTPIITNSPPTNSPSSGGVGGGSTEYVPIGGDPFSIPAVNWLTSATIGDNNYDGIDNINDGMGSIDAIGSEYSDGMSAVQDSTGTLPTSWLLLIGIASAIPLLAGIVSRFLGG